MTGGRKRGIEPKGDRNSNNKNNNNNLFQSPVQDEKESRNTSPYTLCACVCVFFQFANHLTDSNKTWYQNEATGTSPVAVFLKK